MPSSRPQLQRKTPNPARNTRYRNQYQPFTPTHRDKRKKYANPGTYRETAWRWWLVYSPTATSGTGPFRTKKRAIAWYNNNGR